MYGNLKRGEDTEQMGVIDWANWNLQRFPELKMLYHVPNGGKRNPAEAARFKAMGVKAGVPDLCMAAAKGSCVFGSDFVPECCIDSPKAETHEDCCACVLQNVAFAEYD